MVWQRNRNKHRLTVDRRVAKVVAAMADQAGIVVRAAKVDRAVAQEVRVAPVAVRAASASIFAKESLQVLRREDGLHRLQARRHSFPVRPGTRQDSPSPHDRSLFAPSALARRRHQARAQHRPASLCGQRRWHTGPSRRHTAGRSCSACRRARCTTCATDTGPRGRSAEGLTLLGPLPHESRETGA